MYVDSAYALNQPQLISSVKPQAKWNQADSFQRTTGEADSVVPLGRNM